MPMLFSYGTLRDPAVQLANFGRLLGGRADRLPGYAVSMLEIVDAEVVAISGTAYHPVLRPTGAESDLVEGMVFEITEDELAAADAYEVDDYRRVLARLESGVEAWAYIAKE